MLLQLLSWLGMFFLSNAVSHDTAASLLSVWNSCSICWLTVFFFIVTLFIVTVKEIHVMHSCTSSHYGKPHTQLWRDYHDVHFYKQCQGIYFGGKNLFHWNKNLNLNAIPVWTKQCCTITNFLNQHFTSLLLWSSAACHLIWSWNLCCLISYACILLKTGKKSFVPPCKLFEIMGFLNAAVLLLPLFSALMQQTIGFQNTDKRVWAEETMLMNLSQDEYKRVLKVILLFPSLWCHHYYYYDYCYWSCSAANLLAISVSH